MLPQLTIEDLIREAKDFSIRISSDTHEQLRGTTDGKAVGTYLEHLFQDLLAKKYSIEIGNSANGIDFPSPHINTDMKVTSSRQPQSSCPFKSPKQKIFGLGYNLILFVYDKNDNIKHNIKIVDCAFVDEKRTADYTTTKHLIDICKNDGNEDDIVGFLSDRNLPVDDIELRNIAKIVLENPPSQGYLTVSNALQWRLQYSRIVKLRKNEVEGVVKL
jgi:hypothetical protein